LYHRLRECEIYIPSLRERTEDIPLIVDHYLGKHNREMEDMKTVAPAAMDYLVEYAWPGNVRELASVIRVALQTLATNQLEVADLHRILSRAPSSSAPTSVSHQPGKTNGNGNDTQAPSHPRSENEALSSDLSLKDDLARMDQLKVEKTLEKTNGNVSKAAAILGVSRETLHNKIRKYGIDVQGYRER
jgi:DNA-binding NtrC family response regulator